MLGPGSPPSAVHGAEDEAQVEPSTKVSQLREHHSVEVYSNHGKVRLMALSCSHTGTHAHAHIQESWLVSHILALPHAWCLPRLPFFYLHLEFHFLPPFNSKSGLGSGARSTGDAEHECSQGHECPSVGKRE